MTREATPTLASLINSVMSGQHSPEGNCFHCGAEAELDLYIREHRDEVVEVFSAAWNVALSGADDVDPRLAYVNVQVDRDEWVDLRKLTGVEP